MRRAVGVTGVCVLLAWSAVALLGAGVMPAYMTAWLAFLALPTGALPIVLGMELASFGDSAHSGFLRWLLALMPVAALTGLPVLVPFHTLYPWAAHHLSGFAGSWFSEPWFTIRGVAYLLAWTTLAVVSVRPPRDEPRVGLCVGGLAGHAVIGTLAAIDWVMSLSPGLNSAGFGVLLISAQCALALSAAVLVCRVHPPGAIALLLVASGIWASLSLVEYLIVWSADKPAEIMYYLHRGGVVGKSLVWFSVAAVIVSFSLLGVARLGSLRIVLGGCALWLLIVHLVEMVWFVIPSVRGGFSLSLEDIAAILAFGVLAATLCLFLQPSRLRA